ncbi:MAG: hypothetical protein ACRC0L_10615, partial [Angustibacter sp.]
ENAINARYQGALQTVDQHSSGQARTYINEASAARQQAFINDAIANPDSTGFQVQQITREITDDAARNGLSPEVTQLRIQEAVTGIHAPVIERLGNVDPLAALEYLGMHGGEMDPAVVARLEGALAPAAKRERGRQIGAQVSSPGGLPMYQHDSTVEYAMGPARPNKPSDSVVSLIGRSAQDVLGPGAKVVITSGQEDEGRQHGSNRHGTGNAADVAIYRPDGTRITSSDPEMADIARAAARNGALGIGFGAEYMGGDHMHIDIVPPGQGQAHTWASGGVSMRDEIVGIINERSSGGGQGQGFSALLDIEDPEIRAAAMDEYELRSAVADGERKATIAAASEAGFANIVNGGSVNDLTPEQQILIGQDGMKGLIGYEKLVRAGTPVETDLVSLYRLRQVAAYDPVAFAAQASTGFAAYADKLSESDRRSLVEMASSPTSKRDANSAATLMTVATPQLRENSIENGSAEEATIQTSLLAWQDRYIAANGGEAPSQTEVDKQVGRLLAGVIIEPSDAGTWFGATNIEGRVVDTNSLTSVAEILAADALSVGGVEVPPETAAEIAEEMERRGMLVTPETLMQELAIFAEEKL